MIRIFMVIISVTLFSASNTAKIQKYQYVEIEECTIPISAKLNRIIPYDTYEYEIMMQTDNAKEAGTYFIITSTKKWSFQHDEDILKKMIEMFNGKLIEDRHSKGFKIIGIKFDDPIHGKTTAYLLYGEKSSITAYHINKKEIDYLLEYCEKTRR